MRRIGLIQYFSSSILRSLFDFFHNEDRHEDEDQEEKRRKELEDDEGIFLKDRLVANIDKLSANYERQYNSTMPGSKDTPYRQTKA
jgi:hypothetical protein